MDLKKFTQWKESIHIDVNPMLITPIILMIIVLAGEGYFFVMNTSPVLAANSKTATDLDKAKKALTAPGRLPVSDPNQARAQLANAQATLTSQLQVFLSEEQATVILNAFSQFATLCGVQVVNVQSQPATGSKDLFNATVVKLQVQGDSRKLVDFASRLKETFSFQGLVVNNITMAGNDSGMALLTVDMALYTTSLPKPIPTVGKTVIPATPIPTLPLRP